MNDAEIIKYALKLLGLLVNKGRDAISSKLSEGDVTDEMFRQVIATEIDEINKKLDALARKDLLSSLQFLKEGLNRLLMAMQKKSMNSDVPTTSQNTELDILTDVDGASTSQRRVNKAFTILNVIAKNFEVVSLERLTNAKKSFEASREEATRAFSNEALSIDDRIMATELRIVSRILDSFPDDPDAGGSDCLMYLDELHKLPAVREMYSVHVGGGLKSYIKSIFNQNERAQKVKTIRSINAAVFDFIVGFTTSNNVFCLRKNWPTIQLRNRDEKFKFYSRNKIPFIRMKARWPEIDSSLELKETDLFGRHVVSSLERKTEFTVEPLKTDSIVDIKSRIQDKNVLCLTMDASFSLYLLTYVCESSNSAPVFTIFVFDSKELFSKRIKTDLSCDSNSSCFGVFAMHVLKGKIVVLRDQFDSRRINFIDFSTGETYHTIFLPPQPRALEGYLKAYINILNDSEIMVTRNDDKAVYIYTNEGQPKQTLCLPLEKAFRVSDIACRSASEEVLVLTIFSQNSKSSKELPYYRLLVYSTNGALQDSYDLYRYPKLDSICFVNDSEGRVNLFDIWNNQMLRL